MSDNFRFPRQEDSSYRLDSQNQTKDKINGLSKSRNTQQINSITTDSSENSTETQGLPSYAQSSVRTKVYLKHQSYAPAREGNDERKPVREYTTSETSEGSSTVNNNSVRNLIRNYELNLTAPPNLALVRETYFIEEGNKKTLDLEGNRRKETQHKTLLVGKLNETVCNDEYDNNNINIVESNSRRHVINFGSNKYCSNKLTIYDDEQRYRQSKYPSNADELIDFLRVVEAISKSSSINVDESASNISLHNSYVISDDLVLTEMVDNRPVMGGGGISSHGQRFDGESVRARRVSCNIEDSEGSQDYGNSKEQSWSTLNLPLKFKDVNSNKLSSYSSANLNTKSVNIKYSPQSDQTEMIDSSVSSLKLNPSSGNLQRSNTHRKSTEVGRDSMLVAAGFIPPLDVDQHLNDQCTHIQRLGKLSENRNKVHNEEFQGEYRAKSHETTMKKQNLSHGERINPKIDAKSLTDARRSDVLYSFGEKGKANLSVAALKNMFENLSISEISHLQRSKLGLCRKIPLQRIQSEPNLVSSDQINQEITLTEKIKYKTIGRGKRNDFRKVKQDFHDGNTPDCKEKINNDYTDFAIHKDIPINMEPLLSKNTGTTQDIDQSKVKKDVNNEKICRKLQYNSEKQDERLDDPNPNNTTNPPVTEDVGVLPYSTFAGTTTVHSSVKEKVGYFAHMFRNHEETRSWTQEKKILSPRTRKFIKFGESDHQENSVTSQISSSIKPSMDGSSGLFNNLKFTRSDPASSDATRDKKEVRHVGKTVVNFIFDNCYGLGNSEGEAPRQEISADINNRLTSNPLRWMGNRVNNDRASRAVETRKETEAEDILTNSKEQPVEISKNTKSFITNITQNSSEVKSKDIVQSGIGEKSVWKNYSGGKAKSGIGVLEGTVSPLNVRERTTKEMASEKVVQKSSHFDVTDVELGNDREQGSGKHSCSKGTNVCSLIMSKQQLCLSPMKMEEGVKHSHSKCDTKEENPTELEEKMSKNDHREGNTILSPANFIVGNAKSLNIKKYSVSPNPVITNDQRKCNVALLQSNPKDSSRSCIGNSKLMPLTSSTEKNKDASTVRETKVEFVSDTDKSFCTIKTSNASQKLSVPNLSSIISNTCGSVESKAPTKIDTSCHLKYLPECTAATKITYPELRTRNATCASTSNPLNTPNVISANNIEKNSSCGTSISTAELISNAKSATSAALPAMTATYTAASTPAPATPSLETSKSLDTTISLLKSTSTETPTSTTALVLSEIAAPSTTLLNTFSLPTVPSNIKSISTSTATLLPCFTPTSASTTMTPSLFIAPTYTVASVTSTIKIPVTRTSTGAPRFKEPSTFSPTSSSDETSKVSEETISIRENVSNPSSHDISVTVGRTAIGVAPNTAPKSTEPGSGLTAAIEECSKSTDSAIPVHDENTNFIGSQTSNSSTASITDTASAIRSVSDSPSVSPNPLIGGPEGTDSKTMSISPTMSALTDKSETHTIISTAFVLTETFQENSVPLSAAVLTESGSSEPKELPNFRSSLPSEESLTTAALPVSNSLVLSLPTSLSNDLELTIASTAPGGVSPYDDPRSFFAPDELKLPKTYSDLFGMQIQCELTENEEISTILSMKTTPFHTSSTEIEATKKSTGQYLHEDSGQNLSVCHEAIDSSEENSRVIETNANTNTTGENTCATVYLVGDSNEDGQQRDTDEIHKADADTYENSTNEELDISEESQFGSKQISQTILHLNKEHSTDRPSQIIYSGIDVTNNVKWNEDEITEENKTKEDVLDSEIISIFSNTRRFEFQDIPKNTNGRANNAIVFSKETTDNDPHSASEKKELDIEEDVAEAFVRDTLCKWNSIKDFMNDIATEEMRKKQGSQSTDSSCDSEEDTSDSCSDEDELRGNSGSGDSDDTDEEEILAAFEKEAPKYPKPSRQVRSFLRNIPEDSSERQVEEEKEQVQSSESLAGYGSNEVVAPSIRVDYGNVLSLIHKCNEEYLKRFYSTGRGFNEHVNGDIGDCEEYPKIGSLLENNPKDKIYGRLYMRSVAKPTLL